MGSRKARNSDRGPEAVSWKHCLCSVTEARTGTCFSSLVIACWSKVTWILCAVPNLLQKRPPPHPIVSAQHTPPESICVLLFSSSELSSELPTQKLCAGACKVGGSMRAILRGAFFESPPLCIFTFSHKEQLSCVVLQPSPSLPGPKATKKFLLSETRVHGPGSPGSSDRPVHTQKRGRVWLPER